MIGMECCAAPDGYCQQAVMASERATMIERTGVLGGSKENPSDLPEKLRK